MSVKSTALLLEETLHVWNGPHTLLDSLAQDLTFSGASLALHRGVSLGADRD